MGSFGQVAFKTILAMLDRCAPGYSCEEREHNFCIRYNGKTYPRLPRGEHKKQGKGKSPQIEIGHIKQMARQLGLKGECCGAFIPQLKSL
jgi:hypothetical protein